MADYGMIIVTGTLASIGTAGVPGAGLVMLSIVMARSACHWKPSL